MAHGRPGPAAQTAKREQIARLIARGTSNAEACRIAGVNPRTGKRWRHGRTITSSSGAKLHYPPVTSGRKQLISEKRWSPEQISQALRSEFPDDSGRHLVHETIYQAVYRPELGGLPRDLPRVLRTGRRRRRPHRRADARRPGGLAGMTMISHRPAEAAGRTTPGHWEGDLITGAAAPVLPQGQ